jgi:hypothetical protein
LTTRVKLAVPLERELRSAEFVDFNILEHSEGDMSETSDPKSKVEHPAENYREPSDIAKDSSLSRDEKKRAMDTWEQDARQMLTASGEGMPGSREGLEPDDHHRLGEVVRAKDEIGEKPNPKPSH